MASRENDLWITLAGLKSNRFVGNIRENYTTFADCTRVPYLNALDCSLRISNPRSCDNMNVATESCKMRDVDIVAYFS